MSAPQPPTGVHVLHADGRRVELATLRYVGCDLAGQHQWRASVSTSQLLELVAGRLKLGVDVMPARTSLGFDVEPRA